VRAALVAGALAALALVGGAVAAGAQCTALTADDLFLDPAYAIPDTSLPAIEIEIPSFGEVTFPPRGGPVTHIQVVPPQMLLVQDAFVVGTDYTGCLDPDGTARLDFEHVAPYFVRVTYADAHVEHYIVYVITTPSPAPFTGPGAGFHQVSSMPSNVHGYQSSSFANEPSGFTTVSSLDQLINQVTSTWTAGNGDPIDIALRLHGAAGQFQFSRNEVVSDGPAGSANLERLCNKLRGKVRSVTLLSCNAGTGPKGTDFMQKLANCLSTPQGTPHHAQVTVNGNSGKVSSEWHTSNGQTSFHFTTNGGAVSASGPP